MVTRVQSMDNDPDQTQQRITNEVLMEHFSFVPSAFSHRAVDLANEVLYQTMDSIEKVVRERLGNSSEVEQGILKLETLLESLIDLRFDQYEAYLLRNVFVISPALLPYLRLDHHPPEGLPDTLKGADEALLKQIEDERHAYEEELEEYAVVEMADAAYQRKLEALLAAEAELEAFGLSPSLDTHSIMLARLKEAEAKLPELEQSIAALRARPQPTAPMIKTSGQPWQDRSEFIDWHATKQIGANGSEREGDARLDVLKQDMRATGSEEDAKALVNLLSEQMQS